VNPLIIDMAVDFVRTYADRTHHGKEEKILFRDLAQKNLTPELKKTMQELLDEHVWGRKTTASLVAAKEKYLKGDEGNFPRLLLLPGIWAISIPNTSKKKTSISSIPVRNTSIRTNRKKCLPNFGNSTAK